jgi:Domain of unknown function (DUF4917)
VKIGTFEDALADAKNQKFTKQHLLLGNGFSIACFPKLFNYTSLFECAKAGFSPELQKVFVALKTENFEEVIRSLQSASVLAGVYGHKEQREALESGAKEVREQLVNVLATTHPATRADIEDEKFLACRDFLRKVVIGGGQMYTTNYDLLLYWMLMYTTPSNKGEAFKPDDGFRSARDNTVVWQEDSHSQNVHYLHGALHLFDRGDVLEKLTWRLTGTSLIEQTRAALEGNALPVYVAEGDATKKKERIMHSAYLHKSFRSFRGTCKAEKTCLFVYGLSFGQADAHIVDQIREGGIRQLYVSLFGADSSPPNRTLQTFIGAVVGGRPKDKPLSVFYFDAASAKLWG